ncbi:hypothetical protein UT300007_27090 [Clostridium sp. CTA-7]
MVYAGLNLVDLGLNLPHMVKGLKNIKNIKPSLINAGKAIKNFPSKVTGMVKSFGTKGTEFIKDTGKVFKMSFNNHISDTRSVTTGANLGGEFNKLGGSVKKAISDLGDIKAQSEIRRVVLNNIEQSKIAREASNYQEFAKKEAQIYDEISKKKLLEVGGESGKINKYSLSGEEHYQALKEIFGEGNVEWTSKTNISQSERLKINNWDFTPREDLYIKYKDVYNNELYYNQATGKINWPSNNGFLEEIPNEVTVNPSMILDRYGEPTGQFMANATDSYGSRALAPHSEKAKHYYYRPTEEFTMDAGTAAPWFGSNGGATQYLKYHSNGELYTVEELLHDGFLEDITDLVKKGLINVGK